MKRRLFRFPLVAAFASLAALPAAAAPEVVTDIPPVQSLAARVMQGVGEPASILPPGATPHGYSMRPSEAARLEAADIVFWVGEGLTPWLENAIASLAADAVSAELMEAPGVALLEFGEEGHADHDDDRGRKDEHAHEDDDHKDEHAHKDDDDHKDEHAHKDDDDHKDEHAHKDDDDHKDEHAHKEEDGHEHHGDMDPHIWLDPANGKAMLAEMAARLAEIDPANADAYSANAAAGAAELDALAARVEAIVAPVRGKAFFTAHDAYHYFEHRFEIESEGSVALSDAAPPGPARLDRIRNEMREHGALCVFIEPQLDPKLAQTAAEGTGARVAALDPLGADLEAGPGLYPALIENLARSLADCLGGVQ